MSHMHNQQDVGHNPCYTPNNIGTVTGGSSNMDMASVCLLNAVLHAVGFIIISIPYWARKNSCNMAHVHTKQGVDNNPYYTHTTIGRVLGHSG